MSDAALRFGATDDGSLAAEFRKINTQLEGMRRSAEKAAASVDKAFSNIKFGAIAAVVGKVAGDLIGFADGIKKVSIQTDLSAASVQKLQFIAGQADVEFGSITNAIGKMQKALGGFEEGSDKATASLKRLGLNNAAFFAKSPDQQFEDVARAIGGLADQNKRVLAVSDLFGKSGAELLPVLKAIAKESGDLEAKFDSIGGPIGQKTIETLDELGDAASAASLSAKSFGTQILALIAPPVIAGLETISKIFAGLRIQAGGGGNESANLDQQIEFLQKNLDTQLALAGRAGANADKVREEIRARFDKDIAELKRQQEVLLGVGAGGLAAGPGAKPTGPVLGESEEARKKRLKDEEDARAQRTQALATMRAAEADAEFRHQLVLQEINQDSLNKQIAAETAAQGRRTQLMTDAEFFMQSVRETFGLQQIKYEEIKSMSILQIASTLFGALAAHNSKLAKIQQAIALAETIYATATGIMKAFQAYGPTPAGFIAAAKVALVGAIQIVKIKSTNYGSGGSAPTVSGGSSVGAGAADSAIASTSPEVQDTRGATQVYISGMVTRDVVDALLAGLRDGFDRDVVIIPNNSLQAQIIRQS